MNTNVQQAEVRTAFTFFTVKKRTITCGSPAVPHINADVMQNMSIRGNEPLVYFAKPNWVLILSNLSRNGNDSPFAE